MEAFRDYKPKRSIKLGTFSANYKIFTKWEGFNEADNTWEPLENMFKDVPKYVNEFF
jgi:hypothetical protein